MNDQERIEQLVQENRELRAALKSAEQKIQELLTILSQNSRNSHWPSSQDKTRKRKRTKSLRRRSDKKAGGQPGHEGHTLEFSANPEVIETHRPTRCQHCKRSFPLEQSAEETRSRQVIDLPPLKLLVTEHRVERMLCTCCGLATSASFPEGVTNRVQYGPAVRNLAVYLKHEQFIPYDRSQRFIADLFGHHLSPGTLQNFTRMASQRLQEVNRALKTALIGSQVVQFDESGIYIGGKRYWFHTAGTATLTYYQPHRRRGKIATNEIGILPAFRGTAVHDNWSAYLSYDSCQHGLCNVHHLRELNAIEEHFVQKWPTRLKWLLLAAKRAVEVARNKGHQTLPPRKVRQIERLYTKVVHLALLANPPPENGWPRGKRGRPKKTKARNLAERFEKHQSAVLAFVYDFKVPFDNNLAERDIRMVKVQQKISGCFRSWDGAEDFCTIRSYLSTMRKQGFSVWQALGSVFSGPVLMPDLTPV